MQNPVDERTTSAMVNYRMNQLQADLVASRTFPVLDETAEAQFVSSSEVTRIRRSIGLSLIWLGARLAGIRMQPRVSNQC
jgi:hypothetical protein